MGRRYYDWYVPAGNRCRYEEFFGQCQRCLHFVWNIKVKRARAEADSISFYDDVKYDQVLLNEVFYNPRTGRLIHIGCGGTIKIFRMN